ANAPPPAIRREKSKRRCGIAGSEAGTRRAARCGSRAAAPTFTAAGRRLDCAAGTRPRSGCLRRSHPVPPQRFFSFTGLVCSAPPSWVVRPWRSAAAPALVGCQPPPLLSTLAGSSVGPGFKSALADVPWGKSRSGSSGTFIRLFLVSFSLLFLTFLTLLLLRMAPSSRRCLPIRLHFTLQTPCLARV